MTNPQSTNNKIADILADRIEMGANNLASFAERLSEAEWQTPVQGDGRSIGVVVHHVASSYPVEIHLAKTLASGQPITGVTMDVVNEMNAKHAKENSTIGKQETLDLLNQNSKAAADAVRVLSETELKNAATVSLNADAPLTTQFFIEDHALRHSFHHLAKIKASLNS
jgi:hypothetical protein